MKPQTSSTTRNSAAKKTTIETSQPKLNSIPTTGAVTTKPLNLKQFKMEIDHQIAKCLDTLDRQGLKYLRQTLKNSIVFDQQIQQALEMEQNNSKKDKKDIKSTKQTKQSKQQKAHKNSKQTKQIKKSKQKDKSKNTKSSKNIVKQKDTNNNNKQEIQQQIVEQYETFLDDNQQPAKQKTKLGPNPTHPLKQQKSIPLKLQKFQQNIQEPLKPFSKRTASRQGSRQESRPSKQQEKKQKQIITQKQQSKDKDNQKKDIIKIVQKINQLPEQKLKKVGKFIEMLDKSQRIQQQQLLGLNKTKPYLLKQDEVITVSNPSTMKSSVLKNKKNEKATSLYNSIIKGNKKTTPQVQKQGAKYQQHPEQLIQDENQINQEISQVQIQNQINQPKIMEMPSKLMAKNDFQQQRQAKQSVLIQNQQEKMTQSNMGKRTGSEIMKKGSFIKNFPITNIKKPLDIQVTESHQADTLEMNQANSSKMVRLGKKKLGMNKVKLVLLRNRGHPSIIGLTCIQFYNTLGKIIPITLENVKTPSPKLLKLFNGIHNTTNQQQMFTTVFKRDYQIQLEVPQKIGGIKIWNYNKSQIQNSKQTDWIELYINDKLSWQGFIKKGSYNQIVDYCTEGIVEEGFDFNKLNKKQSNQMKISEQSQGPSSTGEIKIESVNSTLNVSKPKQNKADWLQNTLMQQKIKKILEQNQQKQQQFQTKKSIARLPNRFSQIYQQQQNFKTIFNKSKQKFNINTIQKQPQSKQVSQQPIGREIIISTINKAKINNPTAGVVQRTARANSQKVDEEKDIFSSFGQSLVKQKIRTNQINAKVSQITQKIQKLKQTCKKEQQFGYASLINKQQPLPKQIPKIEQKLQMPKEKKNYEKQSLDDFMNDSLFQDDNIKKQKKLKQNSSKNQNQEKYKQADKKFNKKQQQSQKLTNNKNKVDIDDFLNELDDLVGTKENRYQYGNEMQKTVVIPQIPRGNKLQIVLVSNWGDQQFLGLNKVQFFDSQGQRVYPSEAKTLTQSPSIVSIFSQNNGYITQHSAQWKCQKKDQIKLQLTFNKKIQFSLIRVWNYVGDRVHAMIGVRKINILLQGGLIFTGDIRKNAGSSRDQILKSCENILFTNNIGIQKKIMQNDWLTQQIQNQRQQVVLFKKTTESFMRPLTNGLNGRELKIIQNKQGFKLPKRNCFQYDPPNLPSGYYIKIILHTTWGDRDFIGLNGIVVFDQKGNQINQVKKISQFPAPLITLSGYEGDKRILSNLFDGKNLTSNDQSIWLAPYLRDIDKMEKQAQNAILIQFDRLCTFSALNFYNYIKTPERGVRQIEIQIDNSLAYRGYVRMANYQSGQFMTTINFTKDPNILQKINYAGYNQDNLGQQVNFYNQGKPQKPLF